VSSVGVGAEVDPATVRAASIFVEWRGAAEHPPPTGSAELQGLDPSTIAEIGEVLAGDRPGRRSVEELTLYKSTGHAVEDAAAARLVFDRARAEGAGQRFEL
jgi:alanine dehydrogenase